MLDCAHSRDSIARETTVNATANATANITTNIAEEATQAPKVIIVGAGWAGLGAAHHLAEQGYNTTLLEAGPHPGGLVAGWKTPEGKSIEVGIHGFWYPYSNIFALVDKLGLDPFTPWTRSAQYSPAGLEAESPIFQECPLLPMPLGTFLYPEFKRLPLSDRLSAFPLLYAVVDFDNSHEAWQRYDRLSARELFTRYGVSPRLYEDAFNPMLMVGLFAPGEQCSAAAALGMLYYFILAHQPNFDMVWCRGTVGEKIFQPWTEAIARSGGKILTQKRVADLTLAENGNVTGVVCEGGETFAADAVIFAVGVSGMQKILATSAALQQRKEFRSVANLRAIDVLGTRLWFDRKVSIPRPSNACFGFDRNIGWTFFDLNTLHDEYRHAPGSVVEVDFYRADALLPLSNDAIVDRICNHLARCVPAFADANVTDANVVRLSQAVTHFFPGSYPYLLSRRTSFDNVFVSGDWIVTYHGSWSQEKAYVTGLEAANAVIDRFGLGAKAAIVPVADDEPHMQIARGVNQGVRSVLDAIGLG